MARAKLLQDNEFERVYQTQNGQTYILKLEDDWSEIKFYDENGSLIETDQNEFVFKDESPDEDQVRYLLQKMYCPIKQSGLGRAALEFFTEITGASIYTRQLGEDYGDGSHLTDDALVFIDKMQKVGLIESF